MGGGWRLVHETGSAAALHAGSAEALNSSEQGRLARILTASGPALVLGSNQPSSTVDEGALTRAGVALARRRSGGGAVLVGPGLVLWVDFVVPAGDPLWSDDVGRAAWWVGEVWAEVLGHCGLSMWGLSVRGWSVWRQPMRRTPLSPVVCFAGVGPGEVLAADSRKVVGVSQRRTPRGTLLQTAVMLSWTPELYASLLGLGGPGPAHGSGLAELADLADLAVGVGPSAEPALLDALRAVLMP